MPVKLPQATNSWPFTTLSVSKKLAWKIKLNNAIGIAKRDNNCKVQITPFIFKATNLANDEVSNTYISSITNICVQIDLSIGFAC